jgi:hypothetical protein
MQARRKSHYEDDVVVAIRAVIAARFPQSMLTTRNWRHSMEGLTRGIVE